jgi:tetratricopeptide (TPR) repeat protein
LGYGELFVVREMAEIEPEIYERAIEYLQRGLHLSNKLADAPFGNNLAASQTQALCYNGLGIVNLASKKYPTAIEYLEKGTEAVQFSGDKYLHGLNFLYLAESYYHVNNLEIAIYNSCLGMYFLREIDAIEWQQAEGLIKNLLVQIGYENVLTKIAKHRANIIKYIGVDGYDYLLEWLEKYQRSQ